MSPPVVLLLWWCLCFGLGILVRRLRKRKRFSLKSLLLATTVAALLLGTYPAIQTWMTRRNTIQQVRLAFSNVQKSTNTHYFQLVRHNEKQWIISNRCSTFLNGGILLDSRPFAPIEAGKLWISPPDQWVSNADEAIALIEPHL